MPVDKVALVRGVYEEWSQGDFSAGDPFAVYPGNDGPIDSIRWEIFAESLQDYAILQTAGIKREDPMLAELGTYADFPRSEEWLDGTLRKIFGSISR